MNQSRQRNIILVAALATALFACNKKEEAKPAEPTSETATAPSPAAAPAPEATPKAAPAVPAADDGSDYVRVLATHKEPKPSDPVVVEIKDFSVTSSNFDPAKLEAASAEITLDFSSLSSGIDKRDGHLKAADYLDVATMPTAVIKVSGVKKAGDGYEASAEVRAHGVTKTMPVSFKVLEADATSVQIEASKEFDRNDFGISTGDDDTSAPLLKIEMRLTLR